MNPRRLLISTSVSALAAVLLPLFASAAGTPAISAFDEAFSKVNDYTVLVQAHEVKGNQRQDRTYQYWFKKPDLAKTLIIAGDGNGSGGVWNGGDKVSGHQGGMLAWIHLKVDLHDSRATSLRGYTIPEGLLQNEVDKYKTIPGDLSQRPGPMIDGIATDEIGLKVADPAKYDGVTHMTLYLNKQTHWPVRQIREAGNQIVADETFKDLKTNVGLSNGDFPF